MRRGVRTDPGYVISVFAIHLVPFPVYPFYGHQGYEALLLISVCIWGLRCLSDPGRLFCV